MYFPYLRARQFELISLRELVQEGALKEDIITPILEPVKKSHSSLNLANTVFQEHDFRPYLIMNPQVGEIPGDTDIFLEYINNLENNQYRPAFLYSDNEGYISSSIESNDLEDCMLICLDNFYDEESLKDLVTNSKITHVVLLEPQKYRSLDRYLKGLSKMYIRLDDLFEKQQRNSDYLSISKNKFSEEHLYYKDEGYKGFSDYTILPSEYIDSGFAPRAVVIHLSYINSEKENEIWIRHFTSTSNDSIVNVQGKFAEAAEKAIEFIKSQPLTNSATRELVQYYDDKKYPGLGTVKKIAVKNHLIVIDEALKS